MAGELPIVIRSVCNEDVNFILNSWLKSFKESEWFNMSSKAYWVGHRILILKLMSTRSLHVACMADDHDHIVGWACTDPDVIHYVYVKKSFRRLGIAKKLLSAMLDKPATYTHKTFHLQYMKLPTEWKYDIYPAILDKSEVEYYNEAA